MGSGIVGPSDTPHAYVNRSTNFTPTAGVAWQWNQTVYDNANMHRATSGTDSERLYAPEDGLYTVTFGGWISYAGNVSVVDWIIHSNNHSYEAQIYRNFLQGGHCVDVVSKDIPLQAEDFVYCTMGFTGGSSYTVTASARVFFQMTKVATLVPY